VKLPKGKRIDSDGRRRGAGDWARTAEVSEAVVAEACAAPQTATAAACGDRTGRRGRVATGDGHFAAAMDAGGQAGAMQRGLYDPS